MAEAYEKVCLLKSATEGLACFDIMTILNLSLIVVFFSGMVAGACVVLIRQKRKSELQSKSPTARSSQSGNVFFALFAAVGMVGVLGAGMSLVMRGPVTSMATVTKRTIAENNVIASGKLAIVSATTQQPDSGDCDADSYVEPIPYRDAGALPHPTGGGLIPTSIGASLSDPWQLEYGYCAWDHGTVTVSDNNAGCGGSSAKRLEGAPNDTQMAVAIISAGPDMVFQTQCNGYVDANTDNVPDVPLINKPGGSDDIVLGHTYAEANAALGGLWGLKSGAPDTATIDKDIEVAGDASFGGSLALGGGLLLPDQTTSGACSLANDQQLRRNTTGPSLEICNWGGGPGAWVPVGGASAISGLTAAGAPNTINNLAHLQTWNWNSATTGSGLALGSNSLTSGALLNVAVSNAASTGNALQASTNSTGNNATAIRGTATGATGANYGVFGSNASTNGTGVFGAASGTSGNAIGVYGTSASAAGSGVYGSNAASGGIGIQGVVSNGAATGVLGSTPSTTNNAVGVRGEAAGASGTTYGVQGTSASASGFGVSGSNSASGGTGVQGVANTGAATGVLGTTSSTSGYGVYGTATAASGTTYGGYFSNNSASGFGVYATSPGWAVYGTGTGGGVFGGGGSSTTGVYGTGTSYGVSGMTAGATGTAVHGQATHTTGTNVGVYGGSMSTAGYGGLFQGSGATGWGVYSYGGTYGVQANTGNSGVNYGISAATGSASGYAGYFDNTNGAGGWSLFSADDTGIGAGKYLNWGTTRGTTGYGIWDDAGVMKVKNSGGSWTAIAGGAETDPQVGTLTNGKWCTTNGTVIDCTSDAPGGGGVALSGITAAGGTNTINNAAHTQTWNWNSLTTGTGLALGSTSITSGTLLSITATSASSNGVGLRVNATSSSGGVGVMAEAQGNGAYGVFGRSWNTGGVGVWGEASVTGGANYGVVGTTGSASGYGGYFNNSGGGWGLYTTMDFGVGAGKYMNFGATRGSTGYGIRDNGGTIECKNSGGAWAACAGGGGGGGAISALTAATGANTIANGAHTQTWNWDSLTTGAGLALGSTSLTSGSLVRLAASNITSGNVLSIVASNASISGTALSVNTASQSGGSAITAIADGTSGANFGITGTSASASGYGGYFSNGADGWGLYSADDVGLTAGKYLNWGMIRGVAGYGIRDNSGTIECKNSGGAWAACAGGGGGGGAISALTAATGANTINNAANTQTWNWNSITTGNGLNIGSTSITNASLLSVTASNTAGNGNAILAQTTSTSGGQALRAIATGTSGANYGVSAQVSSTTGTAVSGVAGASSGTNYGVYGLSGSTTGYGGYFDNTSAGGWGLYTPDDFGVGAGKYMNFGTTRGTSGYGIRDNAGTIECKNSGGSWAACAGGGGGTPAGLNTEIQFNNSGAFGSSSSLTWSGGTLYAVGPGGGEGIRGVGTYIAVRGRQIGTNGYGLYGDAASSTGTVSGVFGTTASPSGYGGHFTNTGNGFGIYSANDVGIGAGKYLNFGATQGSGGYGVWDDAGVIKVKNSGGSWAALGGGGASLSGLTAATGTNTINNAANTQTWEWNSLAGGNGLVLGSTGSTTGTLLSVSVNSGYAIRANATSSYGLYSTVTDGAAVYGSGTVALGKGVWGRGVAGGYGVMAMNSGATAGSYALYCQATHAQGCAGSQPWFNASDGRLKERIADLPAERGIDAIMKLRPVTYHWKDKNLDEGGGQRLGLIAQEVEAVFPESVGSGNKTVIDLGDGKTETVEATKSMAYSDLVVPLIKAVQQQQAEIDRLRARLDALESGR